MTDLDMKFKVDNFNKKNMLLIEERWPDISEAIRLAADLVASFGYSSETPQTSRSRSERR